MKVDLFDYDLPEELIAQTPLENRTGSRLLGLDKQSGEIKHMQFNQLHELLRPGDLLVLNDTRVIPARLFGLKSDTGAKAEVLLLKPLGDDRWETLLKPAKRFKTGTRIVFSSEAPLLEAIVEEEGEMGGRVLRFQYQGIFNEILDRLGQMPLPPYIKERLNNQNRYQTVYARHEGSAAAPTAGLHFTESYLSFLQQQGIEIAYVTLHVGLGTFRPVSADKVEEHTMHAEYYHMSQQTADSINLVRKQGRRVIAVGTTSARTLETAIRECLGGSNEGELRACSGWTSIFLYPGVPIRLVDGLLTNFHLPKSTLMMLVSAIAGRDPIMNAYREAVEQRYRFFSFGDAMFIS